MSQMTTSLRQPAVTRRAPSGVNAAERTPRSHSSWRCAYTTRVARSCLLLVSQILALLNEWLEEDKLTGSDMAPADAFGAAVAVSGDVAVAGAHLDDDAGDASGSAYVFLLGVPGCEGSFVRGDCNNDGANNIADAIFFLGFLFPAAGGSPPPACLDACDANDDGVLNIADAIATLASLFANLPVPLPAPYPDCGDDPSEDMLICAGYAHCP